MKVLILSSNNGGGHNSVAKAIQEHYLDQGDSCEIKDCLSFLSDDLSETIARSHTFLYRHTPELFDLSYRRSEQNPDLFKGHYGVRQMIELGKYRLGPFIKDEGFEIVICTHVFAAMMLTAAVRRYDLHLRTAIVETDYTNTPGSADNEMDYHFLPDASLIPDLMSSGVPEDRIVVSGIPVQKDILNRIGKKEAKHLMGLDPEHRHLLLMGGSMGCGPMADLLERLHTALDDNIELSIVCGTNEKLKTKLSDQYRTAGNVHVFGYISNASLLMDSADLLLTKPGGISTSEAAAKALPMVLINAVAGCEAHNLNFFLEKGAALTGETEEDLVQCCKDLLDDSDTLSAMASALSRLCREDAAEQIYKTLDPGPRELCIRSADLPPVPAADRAVIPSVQSPLRHGILEVPKAIYEASGIVVNGRRIKSLVFTTDLAIIRNCNADAVLAVYPFTPQQAISEAIIKAAYVPVFCGVGGGTTKGLRTIGLAKDVEAQGAMGVVLNAPITDLNLASVAKAVDIPVIITVVNEDTDIERRLLSGASILNVAGGAQTPEIVAKIRKSFPEVPIIASGGKTEESIRATIRAGANAITYTPPAAQELFKITMAKYREM